MPGGGTVRTTCPYCGVGCGVLATPQGNGTVTIVGDPVHPANFGRLCSKGSALGETVGAEGRLLHPQINGRRASWNAALELVAQRFSATIAEHGPDSVAFYVSGQFLTEDYYVANKLMKGFIDTNSRLCMASSVAGHRRAFGTDTVPGTYEDLELADLVVLVGSNLAWCHPVLFQRLTAARERRPEMRIVAIDPRRTMTARAADLHLAIAPGGDVALFNGLLTWLARNGHADPVYLDRHVSGIEATRAAAECDVAQVAALTGLPPVQIVTFYELFAASSRVVTAYSQGVNQSSAGTDKVNAIINCHLYTGRIGRPGMGPFSLTGQPNAMGGREVGGLANQLANHLALEEPEHRRAVQDFWQSPRMAERPGLKAVELFDAVRDGRVKAIWIAATNPVDSLSDADRVRDALRACPLVVVSDMTAETDTAALAHVLLPAAAWGEKDGTVTNSERRISRQRAFLPAPGEAKPDWWMFAELGRRMGWPDAFAYSGPADIFAEYARLSAHRPDLRRDFDIAALADAPYDAIEPVQWPVGGDERFFADGNFFTPDRRARMVPTPFRAPATQTSAAYPFSLNTGRIRDQWHTMTRTARTARLMSHIAEPFVEIHPDDAAALDIQPATLVRVSTAHGTLLGRAIVTDSQRPGVLFAPMHWTEQFSSQGRVGALMAPNTDPVSGQPELKFTPARAERYEARWYGFAVLATRPAAIAAPYWALARLQHGWSLELADAAAPAAWDGVLPALLPPAAGEREAVAYVDRASGQHRLAVFEDGRLLGALFAAAGPVEVARAWVAAQLTPDIMPPQQRLRLLAGRAGGDSADPGATICVCFGVGANQIVEAATRHGCTTVEAVGRRLGAGTNCGSCRGEIAKLIGEHRVQEAS
jgi:assimilatory nitrate reductase catalytic subunit